MAAQIGDVVVRVGGDITSLRQSMSQGAEAVGSFSSRATKNLRKVAEQTALVGAAAVAAGVGIVAGLVNSGRQAIDTQAKLAQALDGTIGGLRALDMAAGDAGVSSEELSSAMSRFNARLGEAQRGSGAAYEALKRLGLSAENLASMDVDARMAAIADRIKELGLTSSVAQSELRDLGIRNENLAQMMRQGGDAIRAQAEEVRNLGLNLSMVDAAKVEMANDALGVFGDVLTGIQDRLTVASAPYITELSERFREAALESGGFKNEIEATISTVIKGFGKAGDVIQGLRVAIKGVELVAVGFGAAVVTSVQLMLEAYAKLNEGVTSTANKIIEAANLLGADVKLLDPFTDSPFMVGLRDMAEKARENVGDVRAELHDLAMQEMPSAKIDKFLADVAQRATDTAAEVVKARDSMVTMPENYMGGEDGEDEAKKQEAALEAIKSRYMTEQELLREHRETMALIGEEYDAAKFETEEQWRSIREQAEADHISKMQQLNKSGYEGIQNLINAHWGKAGAETAGAMKSVIGTMAVGSRKAFEISKAWAMADAIISTAQGIAAGVRLGWPMGIPAVAWAAATGFAQISAIRSQQFGGAGGAAASGAGTPATAPNPVGVGGSTSGAGGVGAQQTLTVAPIDPNAIFSGSAMQSFGQQIYNYSKDGGKVVFAQ